MVLAVLAFDIRLKLGAFSLVVEHREPITGVTALFGASGSGKTTLLRVIAGLQSNAVGHVQFEDDVWQAPTPRVFVPPHRRDVGVVFQDARLFPHLTVRGNLQFAERRSRSRRSTIRFDDVIAALDLGDLLGRPTHGLSGGERQRVAMGRALLARPRLMLMDEPLAALDLRRKAEILPYIERLPSAFAMPVIYVTHAIEEVARLASHMLVLDHGRVVVSGSVEDVLERLDLHGVTSRFEAGVVLSPRVVGHDDAFLLTHLDLQGQQLTMPQLPLDEGEVVRLRVRARDVVLATSRPEGLSVRNCLEGTVVEIIAEDNTAFAEVFVDIGGARLRSRVTRAAVSELMLRVGEPVFALIKSIAFDRRALPPRSAERPPSTTPVI
ncbi:MAG: molybdenum ABC transporter ATP-binding protein [Pseudomonadota bacterium]